MFKKLLNIISVFGLALLLAMCTNMNDIKVSSPIVGFKADLTASSLAGDQVNTTFLFSTDNGSSWTPYPVLKSGSNFQVKVYDNTLSTDLTSADFYDFDWSGSNPKPSAGGTGDKATFNYGGSANLLVKVTDHHCATALSSFADGSAWNGSEGTVVYYQNGVKKASFAGSTDLCQFTVDNADPTKLWMSNVFGDGQSVMGYAIFNSSTSYWDQTLTIPEQTTSEGGVYKGSGTYDQCRQTLKIDVSYTFGADSYVWTYNFAKAPFCAYSASNWLGVWKGAEGTNTQSCGGNFNGSTDTNNITADGSVANRFHMDNFWGDGVDAYFDLNPATNYWFQTVSIPAQTTSEGGTISAGTGMFDQCTGTFYVACHYTIGGCTYNWTYHFSR
ncbi:MAG TPA: hypothetical protein DGG95_11500 [Cytophagales bacterium]|jgi:hypothetical protein|nr:hypothetical protein [Cytophagales bacterium]